MDNNLLDQALDFAWSRQDIRFCRAMLLTFEAKGKLSEKQVLALLRIKAGVLRSSRGQYR